MKLSIIASAQNERGNIEPLVSRFAEFAGRYDFSLICVDNLSSDGTGDLLQTLAASGKYPFLSYIRITPDIYRGYGHGIMTGVRHAAKDPTTDVIAWTHSDLQTDPADVFRAFDAFTEHLAAGGNPNIIVKGKRIKRKLGDTLFSFGMAAIASTALMVPLFEINAQPKLFHRTFLKYLDDAPDDFSLDLYLLYRAKKNGVAIQSIPVLFHKRIHGESKWATSFGAKRKTIARTIKYIWVLRKNER
jgi:glycosyltransferase involved in cell wall biosynthesis